MILRDVVIVDFWPKNNSFHIGLIVALKAGYEKCSCVLF